MLSYLRVRNLALIEELDLTFGPGLNVLTGETGAGKTMLLSALQLVLGARARPELVRAGEARAEVEALFDVRGDDAAKQRLVGFGLDDDEEIVVRRVVEAEGRARAWINGRLATASQLTALAAGLVDISSQHQHHTLADPASHLSFLDGFAGLGRQRAAMASAWEVVRSLDAEFAAIEAATQASRGDFLRFQLVELEASGVGPEEEAEAGRLRHADALLRGVGGVEGALYSGDGAVVDRLARALGELEDAARLDPSLAGAAAQLEGAVAEIEDVGRALGRYLERTHADPERLGRLEEGLHEARRLRRKYGEDLVAARERVRAELRTLEHAEARRDELADAKEQALNAARGAAAALASARRASATELGNAITRQLQPLGMADAQVILDVAVVELGPTGADRVELLVSTNRGEGVMPLRRVASGGELSRTLLAIKRVLAQVGPVGLYVFDEVDSGVGGGVAEAIGRELAEVAKHHQVLCITHAPQIAAWGQRHLHVAKEVAGARTRSRVRELTPPERLDEIARMLGGRKVGSAAWAAAQELLSQAA